MVTKKFSKEFLLEEILWGSGSQDENPHLVEMVTKKFSKEFLLEEILWGSGSQDENPHLVEDTITGHGRWSIYHRIVFQDSDGLFYTTEYSEGATEQQDESPWEYDGDDIECTQVVRAEKTVLIWVNAEEVAR